MARAALRGWCVGVTSDRRSIELIEMLRRRGARVVHGPTITTVPLELGDGVRTATEALAREPPDVVVLTTGIGTRAWFDAADAIGLGEALRDAMARSRVVARGPKAVAAALAAGIEVQWQAPSACSAEIVTNLAEQGISGRRVALQLDGSDVPMLAATLRRLGAQVVTVPVYRWRVPEEVTPARRLADLVVDGRVDAVTFTSAPAFGNLLAIARDAGTERQLVGALTTTTVPVVVGPVCAAAARAAGIVEVVEPPRARLGAMVLALARHAERVDARRTVMISGRRVVVHRSAVTVDGHVIELPPREHEVLAVLVERSGSVVPKRALMGSRASRDPHAVEVVVTRLRRRLAPMLDVTVVPRRGYILTAT